MKKNFQIKNLTKIVVLSLALAMTAPTVAPLSAPVVASAATQKVKLNATKKTLTEGKTFTLKVSGTKKTVTYSSSKKSVATVTKKGKVTAKKAGSATITAKVDGKKYSCKVTVKAKENKYVTNAPFEAVAVKIGDNTIVAPKGWTKSNITTSGVELYTFVPAEGKTDKGYSNVNIHSTASGAENSSFDLYKEMLEEQVTADYMKTALTAQIGDGVQIEDFKITTEEVNSWKVVVISYTVKQNGQKYVDQKVYDLFAEGYTTEITVSDFGATTTPSLTDAADYMLKSISFK